MPSLNSCLNDIYEPGNIPADPGIPPTIPHIPQLQNGAISFLGAGGLRVDLSKLGSHFADARFAGNGTLSAGITGTHFGTVTFEGSSSLLVGGSAEDFRGVICRLSADGSSLNYNNSFAGLIQTWNSETVDTSGLHDTGSNTSRITIPSSLNGRYGVFQASICLGSVLTIQNGSVVIFKNGGHFLGEALFAGSLDALAQQDTTVSTAPSLLTTGDYYEVFIFCSDTVAFLEDRSSFSMYVVG